MKFDALVLIDCWNEEWIRKENPINAREFYGRILDFCEMLSFTHVYFTDSTYPTHPWFLERYPDAHIIDLDSMLLDNHSNILVGGAAWGVCLHSKITPSFLTLADQATNKNGEPVTYNIYSHPSIVDSQMSITKRIDHDDFIHDGWEPVHNFYKKVRFEDFKYR